jgi:hypothetical protein
VIEFTPLFGDLLLFQVATSISKTTIANAEELPTEFMIISQHGEKLHGDT